METIEIGLVVIDLESLEIVDEFQRFVRPQINPTLTIFGKKLTSIQQADVDGARTYQEVGDELRRFAASYPNAAWASWGDYDARQLERAAGLAAYPSHSTACHISTLGNRMPAYMTIDLDHLRKR
jgi:inhibitor of KinA sporulation pathway (predicted exonuclease)